MSKAVDEILNSIIEEFRAGRKPKEELEAKALFRLLNYCRHPPQTCRCWKSRQTSSEPFNACSCVRRKPRPRDNSVGGLFNVAGADVIDSRLVVDLCAAEAARAAVRPLRGQRQAFVMHPVFPCGEGLMVAPFLKVGLGSSWQEWRQAASKSARASSKVGALPLLCSPGSDPG
jgi:hypothetical protein